ncbi:MAG: hypothetical protein UIQ51_01780 [Bacteroidales bacterium]|nr:hypothetical protein [Bacteroidales bacterium]
MDKAVLDRGKVLLLINQNSQNTPYKRVMFWLHGMSNLHNRHQMTSYGLSYYEQLFCDLYKTG